MARCLLMACRAQSHSSMSAPPTRSQSLWCHLEMCVLWWLRRQRAAGSLLRRMIWTLLHDVTFVLLWRRRCFALVTTATTAMTHMSGGHCHGKTFWVAPYSSTGHSTRLGRCRISRPRPKLLNLLKQQQQQQQQQHNNSIILCDKGRVAAVTILAAARVDHHHTLAAPQTPPSLGNTWRCMF